MYSLLKKIKQGIVKREFILKKQKNEEINAFTQYFGLAHRGTAKCDNDHLYFLFDKIGQPLD